MPIRERSGAAILILQRKSYVDHEAVSNAWMAAPPRHPFFALVIKVGAPLGLALGASMIASDGPLLALDGLGLHSIGSVSATPPSLCIALRASPPRPMPRTCSTRRVRAS